MTLSLVFRGRTGSVRRGQVRSSRAKGKSGQDAGSVNGSAIRVTEDAARRRLAAVRTVPGPTDRTRATSYDTNPVLSAQCGKAKKKSRGRK